MTSTELSTLHDEELQACLFALLIGVEHLADAKDLTASGVPAHTIERLYPMEFHAALPRLRAHVEGGGRVQLFDNYDVAEIKAMEDKLWDSLDRVAHNKAHADHVVMLEGEEAEGFFYHLEAAGKASLQSSRKEKLLEDQIYTDFGHLYLAIWLVLNPSLQSRGHSVRHLLNVVRRLLPDLIPREIEGAAR